MRLTADDNIPLHRPQWLQILSEQDSFFPEHQKNIHNPQHPLTVLLPQDLKLSRSAKEVEAESIAYVICQHYGIDTSEYSFGYVAG